MKKDIILAGVGGQGILSIAASIGFAAVQAGLFLKQAEVHGMSQRGGDVMSHLRLSDSEIASDLIAFGKADMIISVEPMEALRYLNYLSDDGWIITNTRPFINIPNYPDIELLKSEFKNVPNVVAFDADEEARIIKSPKSMNMIVLGAASPYLDIDFETLKKGVSILFKSKGEAIINSNIAALERGREISLLKEKV
ncbi:MAG TPA: indolepyruvate oxidoreductase subunit beta [Ignavibacteria bacterium]|nr:indolepyruvate oxidoreductase subunit beta [Ignavibacteria bacterium]